MGLKKPSNGYILKNVHFASEAMSIEETNLQRPATPVKEINCESITLSLCAFRPVAY